MTSRNELNPDPIDSEDSSPAMDRSSAAEADNARSSQERVDSDDPGRNPDRDPGENPDNDSDAVPAKVETVSLPQTDHQPTPDQAVTTVTTDMPADGSIKPSPGTYTRDEPDVFPGEPDPLTKSG
jgi:hypothetical protein